MESNYLSACVCMQYHLPLMRELKKVSVKMFVVMMELVVSMRESEGVMTVMTMLSPTEGGILSESQSVC